LSLLLAGAGLLAGASVYVKARFVSQEFGRILFLTNKARAALNAAPHHVPATLRRNDAKTPLESCEPLVLSVMSDCGKSFRDCSEKNPIPVRGRAKTKRGGVPVGAPE
jgi:hypothetical protein